ncbi:response regulator [Leptospira langatensis]|uniref:histidine kinase n=1 Tax=Leptospira langatensis TaxID=2484983 RepID=A0A5F1ZPZ0_9LEPT|nr:ATP-binding protein [Leptospira langatensis]TGK01797.1 response regulator [Leptospira langatensis]TGL39404.1 response regulator [Leptospira langatensis]
MDQSSSPKPDFRLLFESSPGLYLILSAELKILAVTDAYLNATLTKREDLLGNGIFDVFTDDPNDPDATGVANLRTSLLRVLEKKQPDTMAVQKYSIQLPDSEGGGFREKYWSPVNSPLLDAKGQVTYIIHKVEDVTEFVQLKQKGTELSKITEELQSRTTQMESEIVRRSLELQESNKKLREAETIKNEFFANVSHELRTPLTLILAPLESLLLSEKTSNLKPEQTQKLHIVHNNSIRLLQLVNSLLDFSKFEAGKMKVEKESVPVCNLVRTILRDFEPVASEKQIHIECDLIASNPSLSMDRYLFERILFNLLSNALKFTPKEGNIFVRLSWEKGFLKLSVKDSGIGIAENDLGKLFQKFQQVEGSSTRKYGGTGLGLAMVKEFSELLGGQVSVESTLGVGSTFTIEVPAELIESSPNDKELAGSKFVSYSPKFYSSESNQEEALSEEDSDLPKVLVCEDNEDLARFISSLLSPFARVKLAKNGKEGMNHVLSWGPDLVLSDVMMPETDGIELCKMIKSDPEAAKTIVILLTALTHREAMLQGWEAKADEYLFKPFHPEELITRVKSLLSMAADRKKIMESIEQKNFQLEFANAELEAFSYSVSHDLRAPLRAIQGYTQMLIEDYSSVMDKDGIRFLNVLIESTRRMENLIDNLLEFSRVGRKELKDSTFDLTEVAESVANQIKDQIQNKTEIIIHPLAKVTSDKDLMSYVFQNLISNAVKYSSKKENPVVEVGVTQTEKGRTFFVKDNGAGFDMKYYNRLFGVFQRLHRQDEFEGTGVGLAIVHRIVTRYKGSVWAEGKLGEGASFYFTIGGTKQEAIAS